MSIISVKNLKKSYQLEKGKTVEILKGVSFEIEEKDFCIIHGPSGSGKSTILHHIAGLELPTSGEIIIDGTDITKLSSDDRAVFRAEKFGMVYQLWYWVKSLFVWENVALPALIDGDSEKIAYAKAMDKLDEVGMVNYAHKRPMQLSGGEQQRIGLARALINSPKIIIADEPTGNLDTHTSDEMMQLFQYLNEHYGHSIIMVTHNLAYLPLANKVVVVQDGLVVDKETMPDFTKGGKNA